MWLAMFCIFLLVIRSYFPYNTYQYIFGELDFETEEEKEKVEEEVEEKKIIRYEEKYLEKCKKLNSKTLEKERLLELKKNIVFENTPLGNVIMFYNVDKETFCYYSDHIIPYKFLETIARKYVILFDCVSLYVFLEEELEKSKWKMENEKKEEKVETLKTKTSNVFAKFKNYNKSTSMAFSSTPPTKQNNVLPINMKKIPIKEKSNRFTYEGKLNNYSFLQKPIQKKIFRYSDFKNNIINKNAFH